MALPICPSGPSRQTTLLSKRPGREKERHAAAAESKLCGKQMLQVALAHCQDAECGMVLLRYRECVSGPVPGSAPGPVADSAWRRSPGLSRLCLCFWFSVRISGGFHIAPMSLFFHGLCSPLVDRLTAADKAPCQQDPLEGQTGDCSVGHTSDFFFDCCFFSALFFLPWSSLVPSGGATCRQYARCLLTSRALTLHG